MFCLYSGFIDLFEGGFVSFLASLQKIQRAFFFWGGGLLKQILALWWFMMGYLCSFFFFFFQGFARSCL